MKVVGDLYTGRTNDLKRRLDEHNKGLTPSTKDTDHGNLFIMKLVWMRMIAKEEKDI